MANTDNDKNLQEPEVGKKPENGNDKPSKEKPKKEHWWTRARKKIHEFTEDHPVITAILKGTANVTAAGAASYVGAKIATKKIERIYNPTYIPQEKTVEIEDNGETYVEAPVNEAEETENE